MNHTEKMKELERLQKENKHLKQEEELSKQWLKLWSNFYKVGDELPPPTFLEDPSEQPPQQSQTVVSKKTRRREVQTDRRQYQIISKVGESYHTSKPTTAEPEGFIT